MSRTAKSRGGDSSRKIPRTLAHVALCGVSLSLVAVSVALLLLTMELRRFRMVNADKTIVLNLGQEKDPFGFDFSASFPSLSLKLQTSQSNDVGETVSGNFRKLPQKWEEMPMRALGTEESVYGVTKHGDGEESVYGVTKDGNGEESVEEVHARLGTVRSLGLTADNFDQYLRVYQILVVHFFVPKNPWSQSLAPDWDRASAIVNRRYKDGRIHLATLDCSFYTMLCEKYDLEGYPSVGVFRKGSDVVFTEDLVSYDPESSSEFRGSDRLVEFAESLLSNSSLDKGAAAAGSQSEYELTKHGEGEKESVYGVTMHGEGEESGEEVHARLAQEGHEHTASIVLTADNFDSYLKEYDILVVEFYTPWCHWCQLLAPAWERASAIVNQRGERFYPEYNGQIGLAKVDCVQNQVLCEKHEVKGFPSIRVFRKGSDAMEHNGRYEHESYYGERDTDSLVKVVESLVPKAPVASDSTETEHSARGDLEEASLFLPGTNILKDQHSLLDRLRGAVRRLARADPGKNEPLKAFTGEQEIPKHMGHYADYM